MFAHKTSDRPFKSAPTIFSPPFEWSRPCGQRGRRHQEMLRSIAGDGPDFKEQSLLIPEARARRSSKDGIACPGSWIEYKCKWTTQLYLCVIIWCDCERAEGRRRYNEQLFWAAVGVTLGASRGWSPALIEFPICLQADLSPGRKMMFVNSLFATSNWTLHVTEDWRPQKIEDYRKSYLVKTISVLGTKRPRGVLKWVEIYTCYL